MRYYRWSLCKRNNTNASQKAPYSKKKKALANIKMLANIVACKLKYSTNCTLKSVTFQVADLIIQMKSVPSGTQISDQVFQFIVYIQILGCFHCVCFYYSKKFQASIKVERTVSFNISSSKLCSPCFIYFFFSPFCYILK